MVVVVGHDELRATTVPDSAPDCHEFCSGSGLPPAWEGCPKTLKNSGLVQALLSPNLAGLIAPNALAELRAFVEGIHNIGAPTFRSGGVGRLIDILL